MAITRVQKWGNSYGLRIPKNIMDEMALKPNSRLEIRQEQGRLILTPVLEPKVALDELLELIRPENIHGETDWGIPAGKEAW